MFKYFPCRRCRVAYATRAERDKHEAACRAAAERIAEPKTQTNERDGKRTDNRQ